MEYMSNCCWVMGGNTAFIGLALSGWEELRGGPVTRELVILAILCRGDAVVTVSCDELTGDGSSPPADDIRLPMLETALLRTGG